MVIGFLRGRYKFDLRNFAPPSKIFFKNGLFSSDPAPRSAAAMGCAGCAMHKGTAARPPLSPHGAYSGISFLLSDTECSQIIFFGLKSNGGQPSKLCTRAYRNPATPLVPRVSSGGCAYAVTHIL